MTQDFDIIVDAGPALTFLARKDTTKVLFQGLRGLSAYPGFASPEAVRNEVLRKSTQKRVLQAAGNKWKTLENSRRIQVLSDDETKELSVAVQRLCNMPMTQRLSQSKDLGEVMVIAHASVIADTGRRVTILIEERAGTELAKKDCPVCPLVATTRQYPGLEHRGGPPTSNWKPTKSPTRKL